jgi:hypothetical protein
MRIDPPTEARPPTGGRDGGTVSAGRRRLRLRRRVHRPDGRAAAPRHGGSAAARSGGAARHRATDRPAAVPGIATCAEVTAAELRRWALAPWPEAVGVLWPTPSLAGAPTGTMVCRACLERRPRAATGQRPDRSRAIVLFGPDAARRVARRCAVHATESPDPPP